MAASKPFTISECAAGALSSCFSVISSAFGHEAPFIDMFFPNHDTAEGARQGTARLRSWQESDDHAHFVKATSTLPNAPNGGTVGFAAWTLMTKIPPQSLDEASDVASIWGKLENPQAESDFARQIWSKYVLPRSAAVRDSNGKGVYVLEMLAVHPDVQGQGVGEALVRWGTRAADRKGLEAVVESTPVGRKVYEKCGFKTTIERMDLDVDQKFADRRKPILIFLRRKLDANSVQND